MVEARPRTSRARSATRSCLAAIVLAGCAAGAAAAERSAPSVELPPDAASVPDDAALEAAGAVIGQIRIERGNVFDPTQPGEDNPIFRAANFVHIRTRESTIRSLLLFKEGDPYSRRVLYESERILRGFRFLYDAQIRPVRYEGGKVDVAVATRDVWTLRAGINIGRSGGVNQVQIGIEEQNLLGFGKALSIKRSSDVDRTSQRYGYLDPFIFGSRVRGSFFFSNNSDGQERMIVVDRPFYSFAARRAGGFLAYRGDRVDPLYDLGRAYARFRHEVETVTAYAGFSRGLAGTRARRLSAGFTFERHVFGVAPGEIPPVPMPAGRTLSYPWIAFDSVQDGFIAVHDLDRIQRTEDLNLAREGRAKLGWAAPAFGSDRGRAVFEASYRLGLGPQPGQMIVTSGAVSGRGTSDGFENVLASWDARVFLRDFGRHLFYGTVRADAAYRLDGENQLLLGGDTGLRGYPLRYQDGDRRVLLTVEQRFYSDWHILKLFRVGAAVFVDAGRCWFSDGSGRGDLGILRDVGVGLRLASSRSATAVMGHLDLAFALDGDPTVDRFQISFVTKETF